MSRSDDRALAPVRVLHIVDDLSPDGLQMGLLQFVQRTQDRFTHLVCCVRGLGPFAQRFDDLGVPIHFLAKATGHEWGLIWRIARLCRAVRPDIVHTRGWSAIDGVAGARLARVPVVIHSEEGFENEHAPIIQRRITLRRLLAPWIDRIVAVSEHLQHWLLDDVRIAPAKVVLIRNGVDTEDFQRRPNRDQLRRGADYEAGEFLIGTVGRLDTVKNSIALLEAFHGLSAVHPHARLIFVGDGPQKVALEEAMQRHGLATAVRLVGRREDVAEWLSLMDLFVLPSLTEGTSNALLEAMAVGLPVVATDVGGNREIVVDGATGRLVSVGDAAALRDAMEFYCLHEGVRAEHGAAGRARVVERWSIEATVAGYTGVYFDALSRRARSASKPSCAA